MIADSERWSRRQFIGRAVATGAAGVLGVGLGRVALDLLGGPPFALAAEPPPETTTIRLMRNPALCLAPQYYAAELLHGEGFTDVLYPAVDPPETVAALSSGTVDMTMHTPGPLIMGVDAGFQIVMLGGVHVGCFELFGTDRIRTIRDLKGKTVYAGPMGSGRQVFLASMLAYVGLDPREDIRWVDHPPAKAMKLLSESKIDAMLAFPPDPQEMRARKIGHVVVNTMMDRPWSQYFCCFVAANRGFMQRHPVATKRVLRAILKSADLCARNPERVARFLVDNRYAKRYDYALQGMKEMLYDRWREYDSEDSVRFHALRLQDGGLIKSSPKTIIARGTDWRFLNELKRELKRSNLDPLDHLGHFAHRHPGG